MIRSCSIYSLKIVATSFVFEYYSGVVLFHNIVRWLITAANGGSDGRFVKLTEYFISLIVFSGI